MANPEHVALVRTVEEWNSWRAENREIRPDLSGADLRWANIEGVDLHNADLSAAVLHQAFLYTANLSGANLRRADLRGARLNGVNLIAANLAEADFSPIYLHPASLTMANLTRADLHRVNLTDAFLYDANLTEANLSEANLYRANLSLADLTKAKLRDTAFAGAILRNAKGLTECKFDGPCVLDHRTIQRSGRLPLPFLRGCGLPDALIDYLPSLLSEPIQFFSCFISYSTRDQDFTERLHADLPPSCFDRTTGGGVGNLL